jgi:hypothetical protein
VTVDGNAVDFIDSNCAGWKCRHGHRWRDNRIYVTKNFQKRGAQAVAAIAGLDIFDAAVGCSLRHDVAVIAIRPCERAGVAGRDGCGLLGVSDRLQNPLQHVRLEVNAIGSDVGVQRSERVDRRLKGLAHPGRHRGVAEVDAAPNPDPVELDRRHIKAARRHRQAGGIAQIAGRDHFQKQRCVGDGTRDRPGMRQRSP